jgi:hypothetical protein
MLNKDQILEEGETPGGAALGSNATAAQVQHH